MDLKELLENQKDLDMLKLVAILSNQIERKTTVERVDGFVRQDGKLIDIETSSSLDEAGGIIEQTTFNLRVFDCGCISQGRESMGGMDYKGNIVCKDHLFTCDRCHRPISNLTLKILRENFYCKWCYFIRLFFPKW